MTTTLRMKTTRTRKTRRSDLRSGGLQVEPAPWSEFFRHPFPPFVRRICMQRMIPLPILFFSILAGAQASTPAAAQSSSSSHVHDFVIFATVFTSQGFALPGARVRVRRTDQKKFRWEAVSDHQGELGIRVKQGVEYEIRVEARGFQTQTRKVDASGGNREDLTLRMEPVAGGGK